MKGKGKERKRTDRPMGESDSQPMDGCPEWVMSGICRE